MSVDPHTNETGERSDVHPAARILFGWVSSDRTGQVIFWGLAILGVLFVAADAFIDRHPENDIESYFGFYGAYGFFAFSFVVLMGWPLGRLLHRDENYYDDQDPEMEDDQ